jgi:diacylglycerol O-acyltransferase / wax synthase
VRQLNAQDDRWLAIDTPENPYQIGALLLFETDSESPPELFFDAVRRHFEMRLPTTPLLVRYEPAPFHFDTGMWCNLDRCDLDQHIVRVESDQPHSVDDLNAFVARQVMQRWDPGQAPFRVFVFDRIQSQNGRERVAMMLQTHHALADGVGFQAIVAALTDPDRHKEGESTPSAEDSVGSHARSFERPPFAATWLISSALRFAREAIADRRRSEARARARAELADFKKQPDKRRARTPTIEGLPTTNSHRRLYDSLSLPLEGFKSSAKALGGSVNDAFLTVAGGAMRSYLDDRGLLEALGNRPLVGLGARSHRRPEHGEYGNYIGLLIPQLGTHLADPVTRFEAVRAAMRSELERSDLLMRMAGRDDHPFGARDRRAGPEEGTSAGNVSVSNVPGPSAPRYLAGYRMLANHPAPNLPAGHLVNITLRRYVDSLDFGFVSCPTIVPDLSKIRDHFAEAYRDLVTAASSR